jgi:hypothetical protein
MRYQLGLLQLAFADEIAADIFCLARAFNLTRPPTVRWLVKELLKTRPQKKLMVNKGELCPVRNGWRIVTREGLTQEEETLTLGHELCHWWFVETGSTPPPWIEELCDAVSARLAAPDALFRAAVKLYGHRVHALAKTFRTTQAVALLRIAETEGRACVIESSRGLIARGDDFDWNRDWWSIPRTEAHPIKVDGRWGMMAVVAE